MYIYNIKCKQETVNILGKYLYKFTLYTINTIYNIIHVYFYILIEINAFVKNIQFL